MGIGNEVKQLPNFLCRLKMPKIAGAGSLKKSATKVKK